MLIPNMMENLQYLLISHSNNQLNASSLNNCFLLKLQWHNKEECSNYSIACSRHT